MTCISSFWIIYYLYTHHSWYVRSLHLTSPHLSCEFRENFQFVCNKKHFINMELMHVGNVKSNSGLLTDPNNRIYVSITVIVQQSMHAQLYLGYKEIINAQVKTWTSKIFHFELFSFTFRNSISSKQCLTTNKRRQCVSYMLSYGNEQVKQSQQLPWFKRF